LFSNQKTANWSANIKGKPVLRQILLKTFSFLCCQLLILTQY
jgi:hypothetical protein